MNNVTYTWDCTTVDTYPASGEYQDVVFNVHWRLTGTVEVNAVEYSQTIIGTQSIAMTSTPATFIPFESLTNALVSQWVQDSMGTENVLLAKTSIEAQLQERIAPTVVTRRIIEPAE